MSLKGHVMDSDIKERWVAALRSGQYEQGVGYLTYKLEDEVNRYCCLGVLCDILSDESDLFTKSYDPSKSHLTKYGDSFYELNFSQQDFLKIGLSEIAPLVYMNDTDGKSFNEIADFIEETL
jgi:hypothetical protein